MIDPTLGMLVAKIFAALTAVSLMGAGIYLVPTRRTHGILALVGAVVMMITFIMVQSTHDAATALAINGLASIGSLGAIANAAVVWFRYSNSNDRDSFVIRRTSIVAVLGGTVTLSAALSVLSEWNSPWRITIVALIGVLTVIAAAHSVFDAPERSVA